MPRRSQRDGVHCRGARRQRREKGKKPVDENEEVEQEDGGLDCVVFVRVSVRPAGCGSAVGSALAPVW